MRINGLFVFGITAVLSLAMSAKADMLDVIELELVEGCSLETYLAAVDDFNEYYKDKDYQTEILQPLHAQNQNTIVWVGRSPSSQAFGKAYDHWLAGVEKDGSDVSKLSARFQKCSNLSSRSSFITAR